VEDVATCYVQITGRIPASARMNRLADKWKRFLFLHDMSITKIMEISEELLSVIQLLGETTNEELFSGLVQCRGKK
jgi:hypothetical protein